jgi:hypothetical protein|tara:strand:+ start:1241 stop:1654 length:414 start_codon:yes stop_codon:yes gene_type:complete
MTDLVLTVDTVIDTYLKLRNKKEAIESETKEKVKGIKDNMAKLEGWIKEQADKQGVKSFKTDHGTAFLTTTDFAQVADWDAVLDYIKSNDAFDMLEKRVSKTAVRGYIEKNKTVPSGVNYGTRIDVNVRKPVAKADD